MNLVISFPTEKFRQVCVFEFKFFRLHSLICSKTRLKVENESMFV